ncbi:deoxyribose-phosphate aldolase [Kiloniella sp. b19]|uniref:deoxyribose-phosphate aldolase n=1 Tax=Kiloniella sp. GXU_MW_B19 TaxID=3141326 RepID=UPI0031DC62AB
MSEKDKNTLTRLAISCLDLTSLNGDETQNDIIALCNRAKQPQATAAVCVYAPHVPLAVKELAGTGIQIAAVANFPGGDEGLDAAREQTKALLDSGANEVDLVIPYRDWQNGQHGLVTDMVEACSELCSGRGLLKVILESGAFSDQEDLYTLSRAVIGAGADIIKTSTGKTEVSATPQAAMTMLHAIRDSGARCGFKASGGIRTTEQAHRFMGFAEQVMGPEWISPKTFRFGASGLLTDLLASLGHSSGSDSGTSSSY